MTLSLRLCQVPQCPVCKQNVYAESKNDNMVQATLFGARNYAVCPQCFQTVDISDITPQYKRRWTLCVKRKNRDRTGGAFLASYKGGSVRLVTSPEINCPNCKADLPGTCKFCFECGHPLSKDSTSGAGKTYTLPPLPVKITKKADDPDCATRVSIGGDSSFGYYCTYRGGLQDCIRSIRQALRSMQEIQGEPPISPDGGKKYA